MEGSPSPHDEGRGIAARPGAPWPAEWTFEIPSSDGRLARGQRTRRNVAEALVDLLREGDPDPTAKAIAERAGVSLRLVFHHFSDIDDLYNAVGALQLERHWTDLPELPPKLSLSSRIERTVRHRSILYEEVSPVRRAAIRRSGSSLRITEAMAYTDGLLVQNLSAAFAPELAQTEEGERADLLVSLDAVSSWEAWDRVRRCSKLPVPAARRIMTRLLASLLSHEANAPSL